MEPVGILALVFALFWWVVLIISFDKDRSRYRNCYFLFFALISTVGAVSFLVNDGGETLLTIVILTGSAILLVPAFLIHNGVVMYKMEGWTITSWSSIPCP